MKNSYVQYSIVFKSKIETTEYTEWQRPLSGLHSIMKGTFSTFLKSCRVRSAAERADTLPLFLLYPYMYSVFEKLNYN